METVAQLRRRACLGLDERQDPRSSPMKFTTPVVKARWHGPLGAMIVAATDRGVAGVWFEGQKHMPLHAQWREDAAHEHIRAAIAQLAQYFSGKRSAFDLQLDL